MTHTINIVGYDFWYQHIRPDGGPRAQMRTPKGFDVVYDQKTNNIITYFVNNGLHQVNEIESKIKVALITEDRSIAETAPGQPVSTWYPFIEKNYNLFDYVAIYDGKLIDVLPKEKCKITPYGGTFIWPENRQKIYKKNKLCSYITSLKLMTNLHHFRVQLLKSFYQNNPMNIDLFGRGHNPLPESRLGKFLGLADYCYSIVIENFQDGHYFSEKIMDCFLTGTIPIYKGTLHIDEYFDPSGILTFQTREELFLLLNEMSFDEYEKRLDVVEKNFYRAKNYVDSLGFSFHEYFKHLCDKEILKNE